MSEDSFLLLLFDFRRSIGADKPQTTGPSVHFATCGMNSTYVIASLLALVAIGTFVWQIRAWRTQRAESHPAFEAEFFRGRHRRRTQISFLLGVVAVAMVAGMWLTDPLVVGFYWLGVLCILFWIILLALVDASRSHAYFTRVRAAQLAEQAQWHKQLRRPKNPGAAEPEA